MAPGRFRFDQFVLDPDNRLLTRRGAPVEVNARYLDALALLVRQHGKLVTKDQFLADVWGGVPVTDEALTQCIRTLRKSLGDDAGKPRFIQTVPKHGYRFVAPVQLADAPMDSGEAAGASEPSTGVAGQAAPHWLATAMAGTAGGGAAGAAGGALYGFAGVLQPDDSGAGGVSGVLVLVAITALIGLLGGAGVSLGVASGLRSASPSWWRITAGAAAGGMAVGACMRLLGLDALSLLFGQSPADITGALEGLVLGLAVGCACWFASTGADGGRIPRAAMAAAAAGAAAGILITVLGGRLLAGSLNSLAQTFPQSRLRLDQMAGLGGQSELNALGWYVTSASEGALFVTGVVLAIVYVRTRTWSGSGSR